MDTDELSAAVEGVLAAGRIGQPVFVRFTLHGPDEGDAILDRLVRMVQAVRRWLGQALDRLLAVGSLERGQVALTLQFREGATALVSFARGRGHGDGIDLMLLGNRGTISSGPGTGPPWDSAPTAGKGKSDARLRAAVRRALRSGRPEPCAEAAKP
jgi:hypothetical protein